MILLMAMWFCFRFEMQLLTSLSNDIVEEGSQRDNQSPEQRYGWPSRARRWHRATRNHPPSPTPLRRQGKLFTNHLNALIFRMSPTCTSPSRTSSEEHAECHETSWPLLSSEIQRVPLTVRSFRWKTRSSSSCSEETCQSTNYLSAL